MLFQPCFFTSSRLLHTNQPGPLLSCISMHLHAQLPKVPCPNLKSLDASRHGQFKASFSKDHLFLPASSGPNYPCPCIPVQPVIGHMCWRHVTHTWLPHSTLFKQSWNASSPVACDTSVHCLSNRTRIRIPKAYTGK
ncbi:hypothetical protein GGI42DRAFT_33713 [Trichoderma sp. SZMC 28013]